MVSSIRDKSVFVWDAESAKQITSFSIREPEGNSFVFGLTADGRELITAFWGKSANRMDHWDTKTGNHLKRVELPFGPWAISPDRQTLVGHSGNEKPVSLYDASTGKECLKLSEELVRPGYTVAFSNDSKTLAVNRTDIYKDPDTTRVALWEVATGKLLRTLLLSTRYVRWIGFDPDGRTLLTTSEHGPSLISLWDANTGNPILQYPGHTQHVLSLAFMPDGKALVSGSLDGSVRLWDVSTGRQIRELQGHRWSCDVVAITGNGKTILSGGRDGCIRLQDPEGHQIRQILLDGDPEKLDRQLHQYPSTLTLTPDGNSAATWSNGVNNAPALYHLWDLTTGQPRITRPYPTLPLISTDARLAVESIQEKAVASGPAFGFRNGAPGLGGIGGPGDNGGEPAKTGALVRELATGREIIRWMENQNQFGRILAIAPDARTLATIELHREPGGENNTIHVWELLTGKERLMIPCGILDWHIRMAAIAPTSRVLATADDDGTIQYWDLITGKQIPGRGMPDIPGRSGVGSLAFSLILAYLPPGSPMGRSWSGRSRP